MPPGADVRSIDALRDWQAALAGYGELLSESLAGVNLEIQRAHDWLGEQLSRWQRAVRDCQDDITRAKAELSQRKFTGWDDREPDTTVQEKNLRIAKARLEHAEDQVVKCRQWIGRLPKMIDEVYVGPSRRLANFLEAELPKALTDLLRRIASLESYAGERLDYAPTPSTSSVVVAPATRLLPDQKPPANAAAPETKTENPPKPEQPT